jgi:hypothetical protein
MDPKKFIAATAIGLATMAGAAPPAAAAETPARDNGAEVQQTKAAPKRLSPAVMQEILDVKREVQFFQDHHLPVPKETEHDLMRLMVRDDIMKSNPQKVEAVFEKLMANPDDPQARREMKDMFDPQRVQFAATMDPSGPRANVPEKPMFEIKNESGFVSTASFPDAAPKTVSASKFVTGEPAAPAHSEVRAKPDLPKPAAPRARAAPASGANV